MFANVVEVLDKVSRKKSSKNTSIERMCEHDNNLKRNRRTKKLRMSCTEIFRIGGVKTLRKLNAAHTEECVFKNTHHKKEIFCQP